MLLNHKEEEDHKEGNRINSLLKNNNLKIKQNELQINCTHIIISNQIIVL